MKAPPFLIQKDAVGERLHALGANEHLHDESWLQEILRTQPDILPTAEIEPIFHPLIPIGREVTAGTGSIDNLYISHRGYLVLVETKLWRNSEAKREVVAQAIDYGSSISKWNYSNLDEVVRNYTKKYADQTYGLVDWVVHQCGPVAKNLRLGRFLTLIVGDRIRPSVIEMLSYVSKYPHLATDLALIQLTCYRWQLGSDWPLLIVPNIVARTEIIERSIIQVTVKQDGAYQIDVQQEGGTADTKARVTLTEEAFWELLRKQVPEKSYELGRKLVDLYRAKVGISVEPKEASVVVALGIQDTGQQTSLFFLYKNASINVWPGTIRNQLSKAGLDGDLVTSYETELKRILGPASPSGSFSRPIAEVNQEDFARAVDAFISAVQAAEPKE
jgi:hypothetical protein